MNESRRDNDTGAKLLQDDEHGVCLGGHPVNHANGEVNTNGTGDENDKEETDAERNVVIAGDLIAAPRAAALAFATTDAMLNTGVEVAIFTLRGLSARLIGGTLSHDVHLITAGCDAVGARAARVAVSEGRGDGKAAVLVGVGMTWYSEGVERLNCRYHAGLGRVEDGGSDERATVGGSNPCQKCLVGFFNVS